VFILEHCFASNSFYAIREAFSNVYPDKEVPSKTAHRLVTTFRDTGSFLRQETCPASDSVDRRRIAGFNMMGRRPTANTIALLHEFFGERNFGPGL
jgi:hypothetical protein